MLVAYCTHARCDVHAFVMLQDLARTLIAHYSHRYVTSLVQGHVRKPLYERHVFDKLCLCQFIEREFFHFSQEAINAIS